MPELPEVETVRRGLAAAMTGQSIASVRVRRRDLRVALPAEFEAALTGRRIARLGRRAKYLIMECDDSTAVLIHLGMSGRMLIDGAGTNAGPSPWSEVSAAHEHVTFGLADGTTVRFSDPRRFGLMVLARTDELDRHPLLSELGPEPLDEGFDGPALAAALRGKRSPIKTALLDQRVVAGLGNIYACESLFGAGISPRRKAATVQGGRADRLAGAIRRVLAAAIEAGGSTLRDHAAPSGEIGYFQHHFKVYGRAGERCPGCDCDRSIARIVQSGRSTFYCPTRQR